VESAGVVVDVVPALVGLGRPLVGGCPAVAAGAVEEFDGSIAEVVEFVFEFGAEFTFLVECPLVLVECCLRSGALGGLALCTREGLGMG